MPLLVDPVIAPEQFSNTTQPTLRTDVIVLRPWTERDAAAIVAAYQEPAIQRWHVRAMTSAEALHWILDAHTSWSEGTAASWAVEVDGAMAGRMTLKLQPAFGGAVASYWTCRWASGRGIAPRGLIAATSWAFEAGFHRIELEHSTANPASCRVAAKAGFEAEGTRRSAMLHADGWHDMHVHARIAGGR
ncbi:hypothetical protein MLP_12970 [Microlunatus phosphovorus NM-1]|uniref:N-acetyltransferase domain-containing protein n=1 Tax=Microlunatus phosphovorus (strain ATCC 700054 / DSM 10555 / JCM 9379 / NBRC 101784 / NCIMB 13414 / VKM Ac-1990 / NM-1) TaxID=1032480 RepID=F5XPK3_MICPN|nr:GNAT family N-acetyltransferase [Microlunatus phosphovorus]BAK34311.1 hypothetical protein MLP_12970 [Microlunatus phosphovorus NM-1]